MFGIIVVVVGLCEWFQFTTVDLSDEGGLLYT